MRGCRFREDFRGIGGGRAGACGMGFAGWRVGSVGAVASREARVGGDGGLLLLLLHCRVEGCCEVGRGAMGCWRGCSR